ncbi:two-component sensor histidine kinase BarA, partial [Vibrio parahaemolyticus]|nr:two-component sensor histidine kinase BarA [Vibrio parahaemolyticus]
FTLRLHITEMPMSDWLDPQVLSNKQLLLVEPNMQAASIVQQLLVQAGLTVTYRSAMPEESDHFDYVLLNLAPSKETDVELVEQWVQRAISITSNVIVGTPSTELALADLLMKQYPVQCITKPLSRKKLLQTLIAHQPAVVEAPPQE